ncbi:MAG: hypothetical protein IJR87_07300, partial [Bacteroidaceae bacterium]|nr:hypothetical protein [Bacteroidaceae bacterium]
QREEAERRCGMKKKIQRTYYARRTQGLLRLCMMIDNSYYQPYSSVEDCIHLLDNIYREALDTKFLRRNTWEPLYTEYKIIKIGDTYMRIESNAGKVYLEFQIVEV